MFMLPNYQPAPPPINIFPAGLPEFPNQVSLYLPVCKSKLAAYNQTWSSSQNFRPPSLIIGCGSAGSFDPPAGSIQIHFHGSKMRTWEFQKKQARRNHSRLVFHITKKIHRARTLYLRRHSNKLNLITRKPVFQLMHTRQSWIMNRRKSPMKPRF